jgi:hypothetical protein
VAERERLVGYDDPTPLFVLWALVWCWCSGRSIARLNRFYGNEIDKLLARIAALEERQTEGVFANGP